MMSIHGSGGAWHAPPDMASLSLLIVVCLVGAGVGWIFHARPAWVRKRFVLLQLVVALLFFSGVAALNGLAGTY